MIVFLVDSIRSRRSLFASAALMVLLMKACTILPAFILGKIIDSLSASSTTSPIGITSLLIAFSALILLQSIINPLQTYQLVKLVQHTIKDKSLAWTRSIIARDFQEFSSLKLGGITRSLERGITAHEKLLTFLVTTIIPLTIEIILVSAILLYIAGLTVFFAVVVSSITYLSICHLLINWRRPHLAEANAQEDIVSTRLVNTLHAGKQIKLEQAQSTAMVPLDDSFHDYATAAIRVAASGAALSSARILFIGLCTAGVLAWGIHDQTSGSAMLTVGELVAVFSITGGLLLSISGLAEAYRTLDQFMVDKQRLSAVLALPGIGDLNEQPMTEPFARISLLGQAGLSNGLAVFDANESVAIIGASGAGKTTLLETLAGVVQARRGDLFVEDAALRPTHLRNYLMRVRYCPQHPQFLEGFFAHSVLFGRESAPTLREAISKMGLVDIVDNRAIAEGAKNISGGEAKRLSLLRLINRPGDFNLFDEPTSSLDKDTANQVWELLFSTFRGKGLICVTHDIDALSLFDRVIVMNAGGALADGPWEKLKDEPLIRETLKQLTATP